MARKPLLRQVHRWTSLTFTATIVITAVALALPDPVEWVAYVPLLPLLVLLVTGTWLFVQPYAARRRVRVSTTR